jgi:hypothetical protein
VYVRVYVLIHVTQACIVPISQKETKNHAAKTDIHTRACYVQSRNNCECYVTEGHGQHTWPFLKSYFVLLRAAAEL